MRCAYGWVNRRAGRFPLARWPALLGNYRYASLRPEFARPLRCGRKARFEVETVWLAGRRHAPVYRQM